MKKFIWCLVFFIAHSVAAANPADLRSFGKGKAELILFSSFVCPHCATFNQTIKPDIIKEFVDTNKAKITFVEWVPEESSLTVTLLVRCLPVEKYASFADLMYQNQEKWMTSSNKKDVIIQLAKSFGMQEGEITNCLKNKKLAQDIYMQNKNMLQLYKINSLPSLVIKQNGITKTFVGTDKTEILTELRNML